MGKFKFLIYPAAVFHMCHSLQDNASPLRHFALPKPNRQKSGVHIKKGGLKYFMKNLKPQYACSRRTYKYAQKMQPLSNSLITQNFLKNIFPL